MSKKIVKNRTKKLWRQQFAGIDLSQLKFLDIAFLSVIQERINEAEMCFSARAPLAVIVLCGSALEGILHQCACQHLETFSRSSAAPKNQRGEVKELSKWGMESLINVSCAVGLLQKDVKEFSKMLTKYRNYIHPAEQVRADFTPTMETAQMCVQTLIVAISYMEQSRFNGGGGG